MGIDYKKELEAAAKTMLLVHQPDTLIRITARMIVQKAKVTHAAILLYDKDKNSYVLTVSRGPLGIKIPVGFARMDPDNPLIRFFKERKNKTICNTEGIIYESAMSLMKKEGSETLRRTLSQVLGHMEIFEAVACIPCYFRDDLLGILFLGKKRSGARFKKSEIDFFIALASDVAMAIRNVQLFNELALALEKEHHLFIHTIVALAAAIDAKDHYTHGHTERVTALSLAIAKKYYQKNRLPLDENFLERLRIAALLHDIGKIGTPESILNKPDNLDEEERKKMQEHALVGAVILQPIKELGESVFGVKYHHEKYDGSGYPEGLKGEQIPLIAMIISVADTFDAMTTDRPYRRGLTKTEAVEEIKRSSGRQLSPPFCDLFVELYHEGKI